MTFPDILRPTGYPFRMQKLYLQHDGRITAYHEAWMHNDAITEHWGDLGQKGETREHRRDPKLSEEENLALVLARAIEKGYQSIDPDDEVPLIVEYRVKGFGTPEDLNKRHALEDRLNEALGWAGLGACDGGSIGSDTMEVCCYVVDFEVAKRVIEANLADSQFSDFNRIYDESAE
ncbi:hypothetical protein OT109_00615 [Phycisphaeraceae bacterium D3-23]